MSEELEGSEEQVDEGESQDYSQEQPAAEEPNYGEVVSRYQAAGLDLENTSPEDLAKAHALYSRVQGQSVFTAEDAPKVFQAYMSRLTSSPEGLALLQNSYGLTRAQAQRVQDELADDDVDPRFSKLEQTLQQQQATLQELAQARDYFVAEREAEQLGTQLDSALEGAIDRVAGAREFAHIETDFWTAVSAGVVPEHALTNAGIAAWVKKYVDERSGGRPSAPRRAPSAGARRGSRTTQVKDEDLTPDELTQAIVEHMGLT